MSQDSGTRKLNKEKLNGAMKKSTDDPFTEEHIDRLSELLSGENSPDENEPGQDTSKLKPAEGDDSRTIKIPKE